MQFEIKLIDALLQLEVFNCAIGWRVIAQPSVAGDKSVPFIGST
jgi:hypothetical protein